MHCFQFVQCLFEPQQREAVAERETERETVNVQQVSEQDFGTNPVL